MKKQQNLKVSTEERIITAVVMGAKKHLMKIQKNIS